MEYIALIQDSEQYSPDDFRKVTRTKLLTEHTTIGDLIEWQKKMYPRSEQIRGGHIISMEIVSVD